MRLLATPLLLATLGLLISSEALARIKLVSLPPRERVEIQLDHPSATLVEEERIVGLLPGENHIDFSWANTQIDASSLLLRLLPIDGGPKAQLLAVSYPPNEQALTWSISADKAGPVRVRIGYILGHLQDSYHYRAVADQQEKTLNLQQYLRIDNEANESFEQASIWPGFGPRLQQTIGINQTREVLVGQFPKVPVRKTYSIDPTEYGYADRGQDKLNVLMHYQLDNRRESGLGQYVLPYGKARIFQDDGHGGVAFLGEDWAKATPPGDELKLYLGEARDVVVKRTIARSERQRISGQLFRQEITVRYEIENFKDSPVTLDVRENAERLRDEVGAGSQPAQWRLGPQTTFPDGVDAKHSDAEQLVLHAKLPPRASDGQADKQVHTLHLILDNQW